MPGMHEALSYIYMKGRGEGGMCMCVQVSHESKGGFG